MVLAYSLLDEDQLCVLNDHGWVVCLLDLPEAVMRSRAQERFAREGCTNIEWLPLHLRNIEDLRARYVFVHMLDATSPTSRLVETVLKILDGGEKEPLVTAPH